MVGNPEDRFSCDAVHITIRCSNETRHEKNRLFANAKTKTQISFAVTAKLISAFVFATWIVQFLFYLNPKFQASSHLLWLYSPVCVRPGRKPRRPVFSQRGSYVPRHNFQWYELNPIVLSILISIVFNCFCLRHSIFHLWPYQRVFILHVCSSF